MRSRIGLLLCSAGLFATGCAYNKEMVPVSPTWTAARIANQQRVMALAIDEAVDALDLKAVAGKTVTLELAGVFPHSENELLDYMVMQVEGKVAREGGKVLRKPDPQVMIPGVSTAVAMKEVVPDLRLAVGVSWAGIDNRHKARTDEKRLTGQVGTALGGLIGGYAMKNVGESAVRYGVPGNDTAPTILMVGGPVVAAVWAFWKPPVIHTWTLIGRTRIVVNGNPTGTGTAFRTEGSGSSKVVLDEGSPEGYRAMGGLSKVR